MSYDPTRRVLELAVTVIEAGGRESWTLQLDDVADLRVDRPDTGWDYTELTEVHVAEVAGRQQIELVFWAEPNGLFATFSNLALDQSL